MSVVLIILYPLLCVFVGILGRKTRIGLWGCFALSLFLTPLLVGVGILLLGGRARREEKEA